jgi:hypothetical protein
MEHRLDFVALNKEIEVLGEELKDLSIGHEVQDGEAQRIRVCQEDLHWQKRQLASDKLVIRASMCLQKSLAFGFYYTS